MKQTIAAIIFVYLFCFTSYMCHAVSAASDPNKTPAETKSASSETNISDYNLGLQKHSIEIGPEIYSFTYKEPGGIKDKGVFYGGLLNYTFRGWVPDSPNESFSSGGGAIRAELRYASGDADYNGSLDDGTPYKVNGIEYDAYETRLLFGIDALDKTWLATISTGIGYRYSTDDSSFDPAGYERESNYLYIPIAYQLDGSFVNNWAWGCKLEADFLAWGEQKSHLSDVGLVDIENQQNSGFGLRGSIRFQNKTNAGILTIEPFIRYWNIEQSDYAYIAPDYYYEPENSTTEIGVQFTWRF